MPLKKNNEEIVTLSKEVKNSLQKLGLGRVISKTQVILVKATGKHDEIGTPVCITVDFESIEEALLL
ncbi:MAG: hypothetical protein Ct9H90mP22_8270 [Gammaproteobacteria bacterium]|nr:MAG: hypothetical protein Ct9H90mP22_8270 [Gammaproteobacteria bacterium]